MCLFGVLYLSILMLIQYCLNYYGFLNNVIWWTSPFNLFFLKLSSIFFPLKL